MTRTLKLTSVSCTAITYSFRGEDDCGWALCTINDRTGELAIVSDWGSWSYLWNPKPSCLGNATLTHFIVERGSVDYLADKLLGRGSSRFCAEETTKHFRAELLRRRYTDGHEYNDRLRCYYGDERGQEIALRNGLLEQKYNGSYYLTKDQARALWDDLGSLHNEMDNDFGRYPNEAIYIERYMRLDNHASIFEEPWNEMQSKESHESKVLREFILPALVAAAAAHVAADVGYLKLRAEYETSIRAVGSAAVLG